MAETQSGLAIVWSCNGVTLTAGIVSATTGAKIQSLTLVRDSEKAYVKDDQGQTCGRIDFDGKKTLTLNVVPCAASSKATAVTSLDAWCPAPGTKITIADSNGTIVDGDYLLNRATQNRTNTGAATAEIELEKFEANDITTAVTT
jgi:hypothetical protein